MPAYLPSCLPACKPACLPAHLPACLSAFHPACMPVCLPSRGLPTYLIANLPSCLPVPAYFLLSTHCSPLSVICSLCIAHCSAVASCSSVLFSPLPCSTCSHVYNKEHTACPANQCVAFFTHWCKPLEKLFPPVCPVCLDSFSGQIGWRTCRQNGCRWDGHHGKCHSPHCSLPSALCSLVLLLLLVHLAAVSDIVRDFLAVVNAVVL